MGNPRGAGVPTGRIRFGLLLGLAILAVTVYGGAQAAQAYWTYWNLREEAERAALEVAAKEGQESLGRQMVQAKAREYGLQFEEKDIRIAVESGAVTVSFGWESPIEFPRYTYVLHFQVNATTSRRR